MPAWPCDARDYRSVGSQWSSVFDDIERPFATLLAFARVFEATAMDDALDVLDLLTTELLNDSKVKGQKERLRTIKDLDAAAIMMCQAIGILVDEPCDDSEVRRIPFSKLSKESLREASALANQLARPADDNYHTELVDCYGRVRRFLPTLLRTVQSAGNNI